MDCGPIVGEEFLGPAAEHVARTVVVGNLANSVAVADPVEHNTPNVLAEDSKSVTSCGDFADEGVVISFRPGAAP